MRRNCRIQGIPRLSTLDEYVRIQLKPTRIIESANTDSDQIGSSRDLKVQRRPTISAKYSGNYVSRVRLRRVFLRRALQKLKLRRWHSHRRHMRRSTLPLTIAAMTLQRELRFAAALVSNSAAKATALSSHFFISHECELHITIIVATVVPSLSREVAAECTGSAFPLVFPRKVGVSILGGVKVDENM